VIQGFVGVVTKSLTVEMYLARLIKACLGLLEGLEPQFIITFACNINSFPTAIIAIATQIIRFTQLLDWFLLQGCHHLLLEQFQGLVPTIVTPQLVAALVVDLKGFDQLC
jgi:hypothetical protein